MRQLLFCALLATVGCSSSNPNEHKFRVRNYITEQMRKNGWTNIHTDDDSRARKPTKYTDAAAGLSFALRHTGAHDESTATIVTWVYQDAKARDAARPGWAMITDDLNKGIVNHRMFKWDVEANPELHATILMESPNGNSLVNQFQLLFKELEKHTDELPATPATK
jgi:hypothetical protein